MNPSGTVTALHSFAATDGQYPSSLIQASDGKFFGTMSTGGSSGYYGTVIEITPQGSLTVLYNFTGQADGGVPDGIIEGRDGNRYGTTGPDNTLGDGVVFRISNLNLPTGNGR